MCHIGTEGEKKCDSFAVKEISIMTLKIHTIITNSLEKPAR